MLSSDNDVPIFQMNRKLMKADELGQCLGATLPGFKHRASKVQAHALEHCELGGIGTSKTEGMGEQHRASSLRVDLPQRGLSPSACE